MKSPETKEEALGLDYWRAQWERRAEPKAIAKHTPQVWNKRSREWIAELASEDGKPSMLARVRQTTDFLLSRGALLPEYRAIDVGCGPGLFVAEFAKHIQTAAGLDFSDSFTEYGAKLARERGLQNAEFYTADFSALDIEKAGFSAAFDLVFTSITPAATGKGNLDKLIAMSRKHCYNAAFVHTEDELCSRAAREVFGTEYSPRFMGNGHNALYNYLWHLGYYPETHYIDDVRELPVGEHTAAKLAGSLNLEDEAAIAEIKAWLEREKITSWRSEFKFGGLLWDVTARDSRN
ncbi:MAG: class I SAM-dependent methyltransferase [Oscillospiraceae bacterium]|nr:class I SAM-dependent methyltransferase [Oscillospiraceae bacterium]